jgi:hypothetical protein
LHLDGGIRLRVLHELSTEASRDGAIDLLFLRLRLPVTKNESFRIKTCNETVVAKEKELGFVLTLRLGGR